MGRNGGGGVKSGEKWGGCEKWGEMGGGVKSGEKWGGG